MSTSERAAAGRGLLEARVARAAEFVACVPREIRSLSERPDRLPRVLVTTGIGTSEGHARHLAEMAVRCLGQPARFATTSSLSKGPPPGSENDWLVVFSQGLSANSRHALCDVEAWGGVVLVTGLPQADDPAREELDPEKRSWLEWLARRGVAQVDMGCGTEYGALLRVIGARVGYAVAWSLLRTLASRQMRSIPALDFDAGRLREAQALARHEVLRAFPDGEPVQPFFDANRVLLIVAADGTLELANQLSLKIAEGMLRPAPHCVDVLHFAHGPLQSLVGRPTSILYLAGEDAEWLERFRATLDPRLQDLRVLRARLAMPFAVLEYEAMFDDLVLRALGETDLDLVEWPGKEREAPLYASGPGLPAATSPIQTSQAVRGSKRRDRSFEEAVWPEIESKLAAGQRTALLGLGSIEQHGPQLPLGTDHWIAQALASGLASRLEDAIALPALPLGCADEHLDFAGTLSLRAETLEAIVIDLLDSLSAHGFDRCFIWTAHGGNVDALDAMRDRLTAHARSLAIELAIDTDLRGVAQMQAAAVAEAGHDARAAGPHAGEYETSLVAALRAGSVRPAQLRLGRLAKPDEAQRFFSPRLRPNAPDGVVGDPRRASADRGPDYLEAWIDLLENAYRAAFEGRPEKKRQ